MATADDSNMNNTPPANDIPLPSANRTGRRRRRRRHTPSWLKPFKRVLKLQFILPFILVFIVSVVLIFSVLIVDATTRLNDSFASMNRILVSINETDGTELTLRDFESLRASVKDFENSLRVTESRINLVAPFTNLNPEWSASVELIDITGNLALAVQDMIDGLEPTLNFLVEGNDEETVAAGITSGQRAVELLELGQEKFLSAEVHLTDAQSQLNELDISNISPQFVLQIEELRAYHQQVNDFNAILMDSSEILTEMLGIDDERIYLVLAQNNDELRPSGGFISTYGYFKIRRGRITDFAYQASTPNSPVPPPDSFADTFDPPSWWLPVRRPVVIAWDGSWHANFPETARLAMDYYNTGNNVARPVDGVFAIDISGFELMVDALGEVFVDEYNESVNRGNFRELVYDIRASGLAEAEHKRFVSAIYETIFSDWRTLDQERSADMLGALLEGMRQRHIMLYFDNDEANEALAKLGWAGKQDPATNIDYVMVADANLGNKSNNSVIRSITYDVLISEDGSTNSKLGVFYDYPATLADNDPAVDPDFHGQLDYYAITQVFVPTGVIPNTESDLQSFRLEDTPTHTIFVNRNFELLYDTSEELEYLYSVPNAVEAVGDYQRYRLLIQKQPGARTQDVDVQIRLPQGTQLISSTPEADAVYDLSNQTLDFRIELDNEQWIDVIFD